MFNISLFGSRLFFGDQRIFIYENLFHNLTMFSFKRKKNWRCWNCNASMFV